MEVRNSEGLSLQFICSLGKSPAHRETGSQEADAKFLEFPKIAADGSTGASKSSKTCSDIPNEFRVAACQNRG